MPTGPRVAYLCSDPGIAHGGTKGASVHFREMGRALVEVGATLDIFCARADGPDSVADEPVHVVAPRRMPGPEGEVRALAASADMVDALRAGAPHDLVYERLSLFGVAGMAYARSQDIPLIVEVNAPLWEEAARYRSLHLQSAAKALAFDVMRAAHAVLVVSPAIQRAVVAGGIPPERVHVVPNGVNGDLFDAADPEPRPPALRGRPTMVFIGSLKPWHGIEFLLEAFLLCHESLGLGLWIVGDGPLHDVVERAAVACPDAVVREGPVSHERIPGILKAADIAVAPYTADAPSYFCPLKIVEASAAGCLQVASRVPCVSELLSIPGAVADSGDVELFAPGDAASFADAVRHVLERGTRRRRSAVPDVLRWTTKAAQALRLVQAEVSGA